MSIGRALMSSTVFFDTVEKDKKKRLNSYKGMMKRAQREKRGIAKFKLLSSWISRNIHYRSGSAKGVSTLETGQGDADDIALITAKALEELGVPTEEIEILRGDLFSPSCTRGMGHTILRYDGTYFCYLHGISRYPTNFKESKVFTYSSLLNHFREIN